MQQLLQANLEKIKAFVDRPRQKRVYGLLHRNSDIYFYKCDTYEIVVKCVPLSKAAALPSNFMKVRNLSRIDGEPFMEIKMLTQLAKMSKSCPHYMYMHHWHIHYNHRFTNSNIPMQEMSNSQIMMYLEKLDGNAYEWLVYTHPLLVQIQIMVFQVLFALMKIHKHLGFVHGDAHIGNVMYKKKEVKNQVSCYTIKNVNYYVPHQGQWWFLSDFGRSRNIDIHSTNTDFRWADRPALDILNFLKSLCACMPSLEKQYSLVIHFLCGDTTECNLLDIFQILFSMWTTPPLAGTVAIANHDASFVV